MYPVCLCRKDGLVCLNRRFICCAFGKLDSGRTGHTAFFYMNLLMEISPGVDSQVSHADD